MNSKCKGINKDGSQCRRKIGNNGYCFHHDRQYTEKKKKVVYKTPHEIKVCNLKKKIQELEDANESYEQSLMSNHLDEEDIAQFSLNAVKLGQLQAELAELRRMRGNLTKADQAVKLRYIH